MENLETNSVHEKRGCVRLLVLLIDHVVINGSNIQRYVCVLLKRVAQLVHAAICSTRIIRMANLGNQ